MDHQMARAPLIDADHAANILLNNINEFSEYVNHPLFINGWETIERMYQHNIINVIKILDTHNDVCRLYLLVLLQTANENVVMTQLEFRKVTQPPIATQMIFNLKDMITDADPIYLDLMGEYFAFNEPGLYDLIGSITSNRRPYPKVKVYMEHVKNHNIVKSLTVDFTIENFLTICPKPVDYFYNVKVNSGEIHNHESVSYLSEKYNLTPISALRSRLSTHNFNLTKTVESLTNNPCREVLKNKRPHRKYKTTENIEFLKEVTFIEHKNEILNHIENENAIRTFQYEKAKSNGDLITCMICYNDELLPSEVSNCPAGHLFCSPCIKKGIEVAVGDNKINFKCFLDCNEEFNESIIKKIVDDKLYQRIMRLKQAQEIRDASIEGLETCAFCDYSVILSPDIKVIFCLNPECKKETCRECREENHRPLRCDQVEKAPEVEVRTMIENKMTEVLIRTCYHCNRKFIKEDGCNKMTCYCGKKMCYICRKPVESDYSHFYHDHVLKDKCPLHTDENIIHTKAVEAAARITMNELKEKKPELLEKIDINKLLPGIKKPKSQAALSTVSNINQLLATITGHNVEDIDNLQDMRSLEPKAKKAKHANL